MLIRRVHRSNPASALLESSLAAKTLFTAGFNRGVVAQTGVIPQGMTFLQDTFNFKVKDIKNVVTEGVQGGAPAMRVTGIFQIADEQNANGRIYPYSVLKEAVGQIMQDVPERAVLGEFDHPSDAKIHLDRISHVLTNIWMDGKTVFGEAEILDNQPYGACLRGLFERKVKTGISSRGIGDMEVRESNGEQINYVCEGYSFVTWDAVAEPSVQTAILRVMRESKQKVMAAARAKPSAYPHEVYLNRIAEEIRKSFGS